MIEPAPAASRNFREAVFCALLPGIALRKPSHKVKISLRGTKTVDRA